MKKKTRTPAIRSFAAEVKIERPVLVGLAKTGPIRGCRVGPPAVHPGLVEEIKGPLEVCTKHALHATLIPPQWKGDRMWIVALIGEVQQSDDKLGALKREIIGEVSRRWEV